MPVLVVDDYSTMVRIIRNLLRQLGFSDIDDAHDGAAALAKMRAKRYGLVISDWNMEPMSGYELLREVRVDLALSETPFIMVTAESKTDNVIAARKAGVSNYTVKPFNAQTLRAKIEAVFAAEGGPAPPAQSTIRKSANRLSNQIMCMEKTTAQSIQLKTVALQAFSPKAPLPSKRSHRAAACAIHQQ
jgi:two-component system chemotaxis response regulator CheY